MSVENISFQAKQYANRVCYGCSQFLMVKTEHNSKFNQNLEFA